MSLHKLLKSNKKFITFISCVFIVLKYLLKINEKRLDDSIRPIGNIYLYNNKIYRCYGNYMHLKSFLPVENMDVHKNKR